MRKSLALLILLLPAFSCRNLVLENRTHCPARVHYLVQENLPCPEDQFIYLSVMDGSLQEELAAETALLEDIVPEEYSIPINKRPEVLASGITGLRMGTFDGRSFKIGYGNQGDPIYRFAHRTAIQGDDAFVPVSLRKEYSRVKVTFEREAGERVYSLVVSGNTCGLDVPSGEPIEGDFRYSPLEAAPGVFIFILPRQDDFSLCLEIWGSDETKGGEYSHLTDILLWSILEKLDGFSWKARNLPDLEINISLSGISMEATVHEWLTNSLYPTFI